MAVDGNGGRRKLAGRMGGQSTGSGGVAGGFKPPYQD